jgi:sec-independent protein translocase protein TatA
MFGLGVPEILIIAVIIILLFGAKRLPGIGESLGKTVKEFKNIKKEMSGPKAPVSSQKQEREETENKATSKSENTESEAGGDLADAIQKKVTQKVTDTVLSQVPGIKQAKQLKDKADKIKKFVS